MSTRDILGCQVSLERDGYLETPNARPIGLTGADVFTITPKGLRWWLMCQHGKIGYSKMVRDVVITKDECIRNGIFSVAAWAEKLSLPLLLVQKIIHSERLL